MQVLPFPDNYFKIFFQIFGAILTYSIVLIQFNPGLSKCTLSRNNTQELAELIKKQVYDSAEKIITNVTG